VINEEAMPEMKCPRCGRLEPDFDGFGMLAHTKPAFEHGCGYCSHPSCDGDGNGNWICGICGEMVND
jgi:ribosomal protein L37AE/L43A